MYKSKWLIVLFLFLCLYSKDVKAENNKGTILILSSYNPDIKRMSSFISEFEIALMDENSNFEILIEDLNFKGVEGSYGWKQRVNDEINKYKSNNLKAVILLGQESWTTFLSIGIKSDDFPFFGCIASENGVFVTDNNLDKYPKSVDFKAVAKTLGYAGGALNKYYIKKNIELIKTIYPDLSNIAFISDNTYGGISLQSLFISEMANENDLSYTLLDARDGITVTENKITTLPENSVIILGTWRMGNKGQYLMYSSLERMLSLTSRPVFTISGMGFGDLAVGGAIPVYDSHADDIAHQIVQYYKGDSSAVKFIDSNYEYRFDSEKLQMYGIKTYQLPTNSIVDSRTETQLLLYRQYVFVGSVVLVILIIVTIFILFLYVKNKRLKDNLKLRESELIAAKDKAEESDALKTAFLANMSHEIRTPLNAIIGFSSMMCDDDFTSEEKLEYSGIVKSNTDLLLTLINDILDISRLQATDFSFNYEEVEVVSLMKEVLQTTDHKNINGVEIFLDTEFDSCVLYVDRKRLSQVLINLMTNAYKFTQKGSITMAFGVKDGKCLFSVSDTGIGIPLESQNKVFERFEKVDEFAQGTGLGLAICRQIVTKFGGEIYVDSSYTEGAKFVVMIPFNLLQNPDMNDVC